MRVLPPSNRIWILPLVIGLIAAGLYLVVRAEAKFQQATPQPQWVQHSPSIQKVEASTRPRLYHFFSPDCPCSRANLKELARLARQSQGRLDVWAVIPLDADFTHAQALLRKEGIQAQLVRDTDSAYTRQFGVYATPQAVLCRADGSVFFRGNYNSARFCTDPNTAFVSRAWRALQSGQGLPAFPPVAYEPWGCAIYPDQAPDWVETFVLKN